MNAEWDGCAWCGGIGREHKSDCKALYRKYKTSLDVQREMTERLRAETNAPQSWWITNKKITVSGDVPPQKVAVVQSSKDTRTEVQKRFAAIAEELINDGEKS